MYTFLISAVVFLIISGIIFKGKIKNNQFAVGLIVFAGTLISSIIINGIVGLGEEYTPVLVKERSLPSQLSVIIEKGDTILYHDTFFQYVYEVELDTTKEDSISRKHYADVGYSYDVFYQGSDRPRKVYVDFLPEGDSIPIVKIYRQKRITDNKWVSSFGLPRGRREFHCYIPNDSIHKIMYKWYNKKFLQNEKTEIAQLD